MWRELKPQAMPNGYRYIHVAGERGGPRRRRIKYVHQLVAESFHGPCPDGQEVRHDNGNPADNRVGNLLYGTRADNMNDCRRHGTLARGSRHGIAKLDEAAVAEIKRRLARGGRRRDIAADYGVTIGNIGCIARGETWQYIQPA